MRKRIALTLLFVLLGTGAAFAQARPWIAVSAGLGTYSMEDVNALVAEINQDIAPFEMDEINSGFGFGASFGFDLPTVTVSATYERLTASTDVAVGGESLETNYAANAFLGRIAYRPPLGGPFQLAVGMGAGMIVAAGEWTASEVGLGSASVDVEGSGVLVEGFVSGDWWLSGRFAIAPAVGYRYAKINETELAGETMYNEDGSEFTLDYSGLTARVALKFALR